MDNTDYPTFEHRTLTDKEAALLYLKWLRLTQGKHSESLMLADIDAGWVAKKLDEGGYPHPVDVIFDREGEPLIFWTDTQFDYDQWWEENAESWDAAGD